MKKYGYCRVSTPKQNIERQVRNIQNSYPDAIIIKEVYTGSTFQGRKELDKLSTVKTLIMKTVMMNRCVIVAMKIAEVTNT